MPVRMKVRQHLFSGVQEFTAECQLPTTASMAAALRGISMMIPKSSLKDIAKEPVKIYDQQGNLRLEITVEDFGF